MIHLITFLSGSFTKASFESIVKLIFCIFKVSCIIIVYNFLSSHNENMYKGLNSKL